MDLQTNFDKIEQFRKTKLRIFYIFIGPFVAAIGSFIFGIIGLSNEIGNSFIFLIIGIIGSFLFGFLAFGVPNMQFAKYVKDNLEKLVAKDVYKDCKAKYIESGGFSESDLHKSKLFLSPDEFSSEDTIEGSYKDVEFLATDYVFTVIHITSDKNGTREERFPYPGRLFKFHLERNFKFNLSIVHKYCSGEVFNRHPFKEKLEFESVEFNKKFNSTTDDKEKAYFILRPKEIVSILDFNNTYKGNIAICFQPNYMYLVLDGVKINFNFNVFKKIDSQVINDIKAYYSLPLKIIDMFKLDVARYNNTELDEG